MQKERGMKHKSLTFCKFSVTEPFLYLQLFLILILAVIDRILKIYMTEFLSGVTRVEFIPHFMHFTYIENTGASFGILKNQETFLSIVTFIILIFLLYFIVSKRSKSKILDTALILIAAGGLGNLYDRVFHGYVVDYLEFSFVNYAVFNFADALVNIGAVLLFIYLIFIDKRIFEKKAKDTKDFGEEQDV